MKDKDAFKENLTNLASTTKEILLDLGADYKDAINQIDFKVESSGNNEILTINFEKSEIATEFLGAFK